MTTSKQEKQSTKAAIRILKKLISISEAEGAEDTPYPMIVYSIANIVKATCENLLTKKDGFGEITRTDSLESLMEACNTFIQTCNVFKNNYTHDN